MGMSHLSKTIAILLLATGLAAGQPQDSPFQIGDIKADEVSPGVVNVRFTTTTLRAIKPASTVPVASAPLLLTGELPLRQILESDILGSSLTLDLNGDGRLNQVLVRQGDKGLHLDGALMEPMGGGELDQQQPYRENGKMRRYLLSPDATELSILYYQHPAIGLLLAHRNKRPEVLELPNPHLQLVVFEHSDYVDGPRFLPDPPAFTLTIDGQEPAEKHLLYAWEPALFQSLNRSPRWLRAWWVVLPLDPNPSVTEHALQVKVGPGDSSLGLYAQVNYAVEPGIRLRSNRSIGLIWSPSR